MKYAYESLNALKASLNATRVLSPDYQRDVMSYALSVAAEAYKHGQESAQPQARSITTFDEIERALRAARLDSTEVRIGYTDDAGHYTNRTIVPLSISTGRNLRVIARDVVKDEVRTFRVDRVEWLEKS